MSTTSRLIILTVAVVTVWGIALMLRGTLSAESLPDWRLEGLPSDFSTDSRTWVGEDNKHIDPNLTQAEDVDETLDRLYRDGSGVVSVHVAAFTQYQFGVQHNPMVCYDRSGWELREASELDLVVADNRPDIAGNKDESKDQTKVVRVKVAAWEHKVLGRAMIAYWYQLGDDLVFDRGSLGTARMKWLGRPFKPALMKVLMDTKYTTAGDAEVARARLKAMSQHIYEWLNRSDHDWVPK